MNVTLTPRTTKPPPEARSTLPRGEDFNLRDPVRRFVQVVDHTVLHPVTFFARLRRRGDLAAPLLLIWVPYIGGLFGLYTVYLNIIGVRELHQGTTQRAAWTFLAGIGLTVAAAICVALPTAALFLVFA